MGLPIRLHWVWWRSGCLVRARLLLSLRISSGLNPQAASFHYTAGKAYPGKAYRRMLSTLSNVVEQQMCAKEWKDINFEHVPSLAAARYQKAFNKRCSEQYQVYKASLVKGKAKDQRWCRVPVRCYQKY